MSELTPQARALIDPTAEATLDFIEPNSRRKPHVPFTHDRQIVFLQQIIVTGSRALSALRAGVSYETARRHRKTDLAFAEAWEAADELHNDSIRQKIRELAHDGWDEETFEIIKNKSTGEEVKTLVKRVNKRSDAMTLAYARSRMNEFRDKIDANVTHSGGVLCVAPTAATSEAWEEKWGKAVDARVTFHDAQEKPAEEQKPPEIPPTGSLDRE